MAIFGKNQPSSPGEAPEGAQAGSDTNAENFFKYGETVHETGNYGYAVQLWLSGLHQSPNSMRGYEGFWRSVLAFHQSGEHKKKLTSEVRKSVTLKRPTDKFVLAVLEAGIKPSDSGAMLRASEEAAALEARDVAQQFCIRTLNLLNGETKPSKNAYVKLLDAAESAESYDVAVEAGERASRLDASDGELQARVRNMLAARTMQKAGFSDSASVVEGSYRKNIKNQEAQAELEKRDRLAKDDGTRDRILADAQAAYDENKDDRVAAEKFARALRERGRRTDLIRAMALYGGLYTSTDEFRFRQAADEIRLGMQERTIEALEAKVAAAPDDADLAKQLEEQRLAFRDAKTAAFTEHAKHYPTDLNIKFRLGRLLAEKGEHQEAIGYFQQAQNDAKIRVRVQLAMGRSFMELGGWEDAAVETLKNALSNHSDEKNDLGLEIRYTLMRSLIAKADVENDAQAAEEADRLAGGIAMQDFNYRDIQDQRKSVKELLVRLRG